MRDNWLRDNTGWLRGFPQATNSMFNFLFLISWWSWLNILHKYQPISTQYAIKYQLSRPGGGGSASLAIFMLTNQIIYMQYLQELSYRKQTACQLCTQFVEGISVTLKSTLRVTQGHWKRNHWTDHTRLTIRRVTGRWILSWPWNVGQR